MLRQAAERLAAAGTSAAVDDVLQGSPLELQRRFGRLQAALSAAAAGQGTPAALKSRAATSSVGDRAEDARLAAAECASPEAVKRLAELLGCLEKTGGWAEVGLDLRQEVIAFNQRHGRELDQHCKFLTTSKVRAAVAPKAKSGMLTFPVAALGLSRPRPERNKERDADAAFGGNSGSASLPLLPPPPKPQCSVSDGPPLLGF